MNDDMANRPLDLTALDPTRDSARFNATVSSIARAAMEGLPPTNLVSVLEADDAFDRIARWWPATLVAAGLIIAVSIPELTASNDAKTPASAMDVLGIPPRLTDALRSRETPSLSDLTAALMTNQGQ